MADQKPQVVNPGIPLTTLNSIGDKLAAEKQNQAAPVVTPPVVPAPAAPATPVKEEKKEDALPPQMESVIEPVKKERKPKEAPAAEADPTPEEKKAKEIDSFLTEIGYEEKEETPADESTVEVKPKAEEKTEKRPVGRPKKEVAPAIPVEITEKISRYEKLTEHPIYKALDEFVASGKTDPKEFFSQYQIPDYSKLSPRELYEMDLKAKGISDTSRERALEAFDAKEDYEQEILTSPIKSRLQQEAESKAKPLGSPIDEKAQKEILVKQAQAATKAVEELDGVIDYHLSTNYYGYDLTDEQAERVRESVMNMDTLNRQTGVYEVKNAFHAAMWGDPEIRKGILQKAVKIGRELGGDKWVKERIRVDKKDVVRGGSNPGKTTIEDVIRSKGIITQNGQK